MARTHGPQARHAGHAGRRLIAGQPGRARADGPAVTAGLVVTTLATLLLVGGVVGVGPWDGVYLFRDFVSVPDPVLGANTLGGSGAPRAVPLDAVVAVLSALLPPGLVARLLIVAPLALVGSGVTVLLRRHGAVATAVGAGLAITNPYVAERLLLGQAPTLLGFAMIPWLVLAVRSAGSGWRRAGLVLLAAAPAALTPVGAVMAGVTVLVVGLATRDRSTPWLLLPIIALSLPWLLASFRDPGAGAVSAGADAFAVRADGPLGVIGSVATLGGVWAPGAWPDSRSQLAVVLLQLLLVLVAAAAWWWLGRHASSDPGGPQRAVLDLAGLAYVLPVAGILLLAGPLLPLWRTLQEVPGLALARDTHRWLAWSVLAVAVLVGLGAARVVRIVNDRAGGGQRVARATLATVTAVGVLAVGILTVPDVPGRLARDAGPVAMPPEWGVVVDVLHQRDGRVLLLPWQPFRQVDWVGPVQFLDPFPRALLPEAVHARDLTVRRDGVEWHIGGEEPSWTEGLESGDQVLGAELLRSHGITSVVVWRGSPGQVPTMGPELELVHDGAAWQVWRLR